MVKHKFIVMSDRLDKFTFYVHTQVKIFSHSHKNITIYNEIPNEWSVKTGCSCLLQVRQSESINFSQTFHFCRHDQFKN